MLSISENDFSPVFLVHHWQNDRKNLNTVFAMGVLKTFETVFNRRFHDLANSLERFVEQPEFELTNHILECNLKTFFGGF